ncbi:SGNH/GDSL hydrolase family protein [Aquincola tertiaricarbonis]|uniref:SGNH/GDSL hydrolase family protein n=1 Tax=Aquincola tertiaricarbonis TaxID=391953 RepID=UPI0006152108|nr:GDSL-type esterase/lipase family protein [Aquincola tertiaricarbonis]
MPLVASSQLGKLTGIPIHLANLTALNAAIAAEAADPIGWATGQTFTLGSEPGVARTWNGTHARTVTLAPGRVVTLAAGTNAVLFASGIPASGTGANGDVSVDWSAGVYYLKAAGAWGYAGSLAGLTTDQADSVMARAGRVVAALGDSRIFQNTSIAGGGTGGAYNNIQGMLTWANALAGQRMVFPAEHNKGIAGQTMPEILARMRTDLDPLKFSWLVFMCDLNDLADDRSASAICADYEKVYAYARERGAQVIHIAPYAPYVALNATRSQNLLQVRDYILRVPQRLSHVHTVDAMSLIGDPTSNPPISFQKWIMDSGSGGSGFHQGGGGSQLIGEEIANIWMRYVPAIPTLISSAADTYAVSSTTARPNLWDNPLFLGQGGTAGAGVIAPAAWATGVAVVAGDMRTNGGNTYQATTSGTTGATAPVHGSGSASDGTVTWLFLGAGTIRVKAHVAGTTFAAGSLIIANGNAYATALGGVTGATAPSHTSGDASDGTVVWTFVGSGALSGVADLLTVQRNQGTGTGYVCTADRSDGVGRKQVLAWTGGSSTDVWQLGATNSVAGRVLNGQTLQAEGEVELINCSGLNAPTLRVLTTTNGEQIQSRDFSASTTLHDGIAKNAKLRLKTPEVTLPSLASEPVWTAGEVVAAGAVRRNGGRAYSTAAGGTCGATPPTHATGTVSDGGVLWVYTVSSCAWQFLPTAGAANSRACLTIGRTSFRRIASPA